ncbi:MAG: hypothetical protein IPK35_17025 [Saprospiraceae bacterium]|jgi:hypothetical protein|nr:hypothetical protein [Saprospiraceae bacterium]
MKKNVIHILFVFGITILSSCRKEVPPVVEVYFSFVNAEEYQSITFHPYYIVFQILGHDSGQGTAEGDIFFGRNEFILTQNDFSKKQFITSKAISGRSHSYLSFSLDGEMMFYANGKSFSKFLGKSNNVFPVDFSPENGEAYDVHFIIDIKNSLKQDGGSIKFNLGGASKVIITKY